MKKMKNPLISICIITYNHAEFIRETIESIWNQDYKNIEIILVDDGSKDETPNILTELAKQSPFPMEVILQENTGNRCLNRNRAFAKSKGEFIINFDGDDKFAPKIISHLVSKAIEGEDIFFVFSINFYSFTTKNKEIKIENHYLKKLEKKSPKDLLMAELQGAGSIPLHTTLIKRKVMEEMGGYDEKTRGGDDIDFRIRLFDFTAKKNGKIKLFNEFPSFYYRWHENNLGLNIKNIFENDIYYSIKKYNKKCFPFKIFKHYLKNQTGYDGMLQFIFSDPSNIRHYPKLIFLILKYKIRNLFKKK